MDYEWDERKARRNLAKHGVDFADAVFVFDDPLAIALRELGTREEERWVTVGTDVLGRLLVVVWTMRLYKVRIISARVATSSERRRYEEADET